MTLTKIYHALAVSIVLVLSSGCSSLKVTKTAFGAGGVLVMPPPNAVQGGRMHPVAASSGSYLQGALVQQLNGRGSFAASAYRPDATFSSTNTYSIDDAVRVAKQGGYQYCLITKLGEFRDAAPVTFRDDFVTLNEARLIDVQSNRDVWALLQPFRASGGNIGSYYPLLDQIAAKVAKSILKSATLSSRPPQVNTHQASLSSSVPAATAGYQVDQNLERLRALKEARDQGILTEAEYRKKKQKIVDAL